MSDFNCQTGLKPEIIDKETFERELVLCKKLSADSSCNWGNRQDCGVIPLFYKLYK